MSTAAILRSALALLVTAAAAVPASAVCNPPKSVSTYNFATGAFSYWHTSLPPQSTTLVAQIWSGSTEHTGTCNETSGILYFGATPGDIGVNLSLGDACVVGCPTGSLSIQAFAYSGSLSETLLSKAVETPGAVNFDLSESGNHALGTYSRPRITQSVGRVGNQYTFNVAIDPPASYEGAGPEVVAYNLLYKATATGGDPGRLPSAYVFAGTLPAPGGGGATGTVTVTCDVYSHLVTQIVTAGGPSSVVSQPTRFFCGPILAEPNRKPKNSMSTQTEN